MVWDQAVEDRQFAMEIPGQGNNNNKMIIYAESTIRNIVFSLPATSYEEQISLWISGKDNSKAKKAVPLDDAFALFVVFSLQRYWKLHLNKSFIQCLEQRLLEYERLEVGSKKIMFQIFQCLSAVVLSLIFQFTCCFQSCMQFNQELFNKITWYHTSQCRNWDAEDAVPSCNFLSLQLLNLHIIFYLKSWKQSSELGDEKV